MWKSPSKVAFFLPYIHPNFIEIFFNTHLKKNLFFSEAFRYRLQYFSLPLLAQLAGFLLCLNLQRKGQACKTMMTASWELLQPTIKGSGFPQETRCIYRGLSRLESLTWVTQRFPKTLTLNLRLGKIWAFECALTLANVVVKPSLRNCLPHLQETLKDSGLTCHMPMLIAIWNTC